MGTDVDDICVVSDCPIGGVLGVRLLLHREFQGPDGFGPINLLSLPVSVADWRLFRTCLDSTPAAIDAAMPASWRPVWGQAKLRAGPLQAPLYEALRRAGGQVG